MHEYEPAPAWMAEGRCQGVNPVLFFPTRGESTREAKRVCGECPVRQECLDHAMERGEKFGIWGGLSERERRRIRQRSASARRALATPA